MIYVEGGREGNTYLNLCDIMELREKYWQIIIANYGTASYRNSIIYNFNVVKTTIYYNYWGIHFEIFK